MSDLLSFNPVRAVDRNGDPVPGARAFFFRTGTSTPATVYTSSSLSTPHPVPLVADGRGNFPAVFASDSFAFKVDVRTPDGVSLPGFPLDPVIRVPSSTAGASQITFAPFSSISATNVQGAIEQVFNAISGGAAAFGIGVTGNAPTVANVDATNIATGFYRFTDEATGTLPSGWAADNATGTLWMIRETASNGVMVVSRRDQDGMFYRRLSGGEWQSWIRLGQRTLTTETWEAGTSTTPASVSPADVKAAIEALAPEPDSLTLLASWDHSTNVSQIDLTDLAGWDVILIVSRASASGNDTNIQLSTNNGSSFISTGYTTVRGVITSAPAVSHSSLTSAFQIINPLTSGKAHFDLLIKGMKDLAFYDYMIGRFSLQMASGARDGGPFNAIRLIAAGGAGTPVFNGGSVKVFGVRE